MQKTTRKKQGFSLIELIVAIVIFSGIMLLLGATSRSVMTVNESMKNSSSNVSSALSLSILKDDLEHTTAGQGVQIQQRDTDPQTGTPITTTITGYGAEDGERQVRRDAIAVLSLSDRDDFANYSDYQPNFDQIILYWATADSTQDEPGQLIRQTVIPIAGGTPGSLEAVDLSGSFPNDPANNSVEYNIISTQVIADNVQEFIVEEDPFGNSNNINARLILGQERAKDQAQRTRSEYYELRMHATPAFPSQ